MSLECAHNPSCQHNEKAFQDGVAQGRALERADFVAELKKRHVDRLSVYSLVARALLGGTIDTGSYGYGVSVGQTRELRDLLQSLGADVPAPKEEP